MGSRGVAVGGARGPGRARDFKRWGLRGVLAASATASSTAGPSASPHPLTPHRNGEGSLVLPSQVRAVTWARGGLGAGRKEGGESGLTSDYENLQVQLGPSCCNSIALCYLSIKPNTFCLTEDDHSGLKTTGCDLKALRDCTSAASLGNLFQWLIILTTKNCAGFLIWFFFYFSFQLFILFITFFIPEPLNSIVTITFSLWISTIIKLPLQLLFNNLKHLSSLRLPLSDGA